MFLNDLQCSKAFLRVEQGAGQIVARVFVARTDLFPSFHERRAEFGQRDAQAAVRDIVEQVGGVFMKKRQPVFDAGRQAFLGDCLVDLGAHRIAGETGPPGLAEALDAFLVEREFVGRQKRETLEAFAGKLGIRVELAQGLDAVVEQIDTQRRLHPGREDIDQAATHGEFTRGPDFGDGYVAGGRNGALEGLEIELLVHGVVETRAFQPRARRQPFQHEVGRGDDQPPFHAAEPGQCAQAFGYQRPRRGHDVVREHFPLRHIDQQHGVAGKELQGCAQPVGFAGIGDQYQQGMIALPRQFGERQRQRGLGQARPVPHAVIGPRGQKR